MEALSRLIYMLDEDEISGAVAFHGHLCFGLSVGLLASKLALNRLGVEKSIGEELVVFTENDSCAVDAIQYITGATLGRGNLFVKNFGKHAYIFARRDTGRAVRISLKYDVFSNIGDRALRIRKIIGSKKGEELFNVEDVKVVIPPLAEKARSVQCSKCKEPVMKTRTRNKDGRIYCIPCYEKVYIEASR